MTHDAFQEKLLDLAYGELSGRDARKVEAHAESCDACRAELARIRDTRRAMSALGDEPAPSRGEGILLAAARERSRARRPARGVPRWLFAGSVAAVSAVAVVALSYRLLEMRPGPLGTGDRDALLGEARPGPAPAAAPEPPAGAAAAAETKKEEGPAPGLLAGDVPAPAPREEHRAASEERLAKRAAPAAKATRAPPGEPSRFAEPPADDEAAAPRDSVAAMAPHAPPPAAVAAPHAPPAASARPQAPPPAAASGAAPAPSRFARAEEPAGALAAREEAPAAARSRSAPAAPEPAPARRGAGPGVAAPLAAHAESLAVRRYEALRAEGRLTGEIRTFPGCAAETWRKVERDPQGRVVSWVREGTIGGARFRAEAIYGADGRLARARALPLEGGEVPDAGTLVPGDAAGARIDLPPRCDR